jgi:GT2 family glycosyltransferase
MDEGYWMYCEDSDWGLRFRRAGWGLFYVPASHLLHHHGASSRKTRAEMIAAYNLAAARYFRLHAGPLEGLLARWLGIWGTSLRLLGSTLGAIVTLGLWEPLTRRVKLFSKALALQVRWRERWLQPACVPTPEAPGLEMPG